MPKNVTQYDLLISCPGDVSEVVPVIEDVIAEFNQNFSDNLSISIRPRYWKTSAYSESGASPQELLNKQIVNDADLAVAIFKTRFGSPTDKYGSGTEEEIEKMLENKKQVFLFFDKTPVELDGVDMTQYEKVKAFKSRYNGKGIYWEYKGLDEFKDLFRAHITRYFMRIDTSNDDTQGSDLIIKSDSAGKLEEVANVMKFDLGGLVSGAMLHERVAEKIGMINKMSVTKCNTSPVIHLTSKMTIDNRDIELIKYVAESMSIALSSDFFELGDLRTAVGGNFLSSSYLVGSQEEKAKYTAIRDLLSEIRSMSWQVNLEDCYRNLYGIKLIICNDGTSYDEDIDVELTIPTEAYVDFDDLPVPSEKSNYDEEWCFEDIFIISETKDYSDYFSCKNGGYSYNMDKAVVNPLFNNKSYEEEYRDTLREIFDYRVFREKEKVIIKVHFDYIKQHQAVAFPTWIFLENLHKDFEIAYRVCSKKRKNIVERVLKVIG